MTVKSPLEVLWSWSWHKNLEAVVLLFAPFIIDTDRVLVWQVDQGLIGKLIETSLKVKFIDSKPGHIASLANNAHSCFCHATKSVQTSTHIISLTSTTNWQLKYQIIDSQLYQNLILKVTSYWTDHCYLQHEVQIHAPPECRELSRPADQNGLVRHELFVK